MDYQRLIDLTEKVLILSGAIIPSRKGGITRIRVIPEGGNSLVQKNWENSTPAQRKARDAINNAIKLGKLKRASTKMCFRCGKRRAAEYHHTNGYHEGKKLQVRAVCVKCHSAITKKSDTEMPENDGRAVEIKSLLDLTDDILALRGGQVLKFDQTPFDPKVIY